MDTAKTRRPPSLDWTVLAAGLVPSLLVAILFGRVLAQVGDAGLREAVAVRDVAIFWVGGRLARAGSVWAVFDPQAYRAAMEVTLPPTCPRS